MAATQSRRKIVDNRSHQQQLATTLLSDLGLAEALKWCQEDGWNGVARVLLSQRDTNNTKT